jgi:hypothetical protein
MALSFTQMSYRTREADAVLLGVATEHRRGVSCSTLNPPAAIESACAHCTASPSGKSYLCHSKKQNIMHSICALALHAWKSAALPAPKVVPPATGFDASHGLAAGAYTCRTMPKEPKIQPMSMLVANTMQQVGW